MNPTPLSGDAYYSDLIEAQHNYLNKPFIEPEGVLHPPLATSQQCDKVFSLDIENSMIPDVANALYKLLNYERKNAPTVLFVQNASKDTVNKIKKVFYNWHCSFSQENPKSGRLSSGIILSREWLIHRQKDQDELMGVLALNKITNQVKWFFTFSGRNTDIYFTAKIFKFIETKTIKDSSFYLAGRFNFSDQKAGLLSYQFFCDKMKDFRDAPFYCPPELVGTTTTDDNYGIYNKRTLHCIFHNKEASVTFSFRYPLVKIDCDKLKLECYPRIALKEQSLAFPHFLQGLVAYKE